MVLLLGISHAAIVILWLDWGWMDWDGLTHMSGGWCWLLVGFFSPWGLLSSGKLVWASLYSNGRASLYSKGWQQKLQGLLRSRLETPTSFLPHSISQSKSQGQPQPRDRDRLHILRERATMSHCKRHLCSDGKNDCEHLSKWSTTYCVTQYILDRKALLLWLHNDEN